MLELYRRSQVRSVADSALVETRRGKGIAVAQQTTNGLCNRKPCFTKWDTDRGRSDPRLFTRITGYLCIDWYHAR
jgi:hypothetical protein